MIVPTGVAATTKKAEEESVAEAAPAEATEEAPADGVPEATEEKETEE